MRTTAISDFSGGWNPRDSWSAVADNELPDALNVTLDERGGITKRLGLTKYNATQIGSDVLENLWYSAALNLIIAQQGTGLYSSVPGSGVFTGPFHTLSTVARACFVDFLGLVYFASSDDPFRTWNGVAAPSAPLTNAPKASTAAVFQNYIWSAGQTNFPTRVSRSDETAPGTWPTTPLSNDFRTKDDKAITALAPGSGMDTQGRGGLLVFKEDSTYRIYDVKTANYTVISPTHGAAGPLAVETSNGITFAVSTKGIIGMIGDGSDPKILSDKVAPVFHPDQLNMSQQVHMVACRYHERLLFSFARAGSAVNNMTLELHPSQGWIVPHSFGMACSATVEKASVAARTEKLFAGGSNSGFVYEVFKGGSDDGAAIAARAQIRWREPSNGNRCRWRRAILNGRGNFNLYFKKDYDSGVGELFQISIVGIADTWGSGTLWGAGALWGTDLYQGYSNPIYSLGHGRAFSFEIQEISTLSGVTPRLLDDGVAEEVGAFSLYGFSIQHQELGLA